MEIRIKRPVIGEWVRHRKIGIVGEVVDILDYEQAIGDDDGRQQYLRDLLYKQLGDDYRGKYFECFIQVDKAYKKSNYQINEIVILDWDEYQDCEIIK